ncbi:hypothetical protein NEICINOT_03462 [Neisseria cinerea ATCC 14685]|uniref:Uncharacterized protein n=1 Tax=Neisseria cinerea ATCC 14685 TaxID=546262 RepID=D0W1E2_NEICI|nr:hypothetical protein NEICINOT_03462 [Neisseria cinerea ATCC 14685]
MIFRLGNKAGVGLIHCFSVSLMLMVLLKPVWLPASAYLYRGMEDGSLKGEKGRENAGRFLMPSEK